MNYFKRKEEERLEKEKYYAEKPNLRLKYATLSSAGGAIILMMIMVVGLDFISDKMLLFIRGCVGLFAIIFVILTAILVYKVNTSHINDKITRKKK